MKTYQDNGYRYWFDTSLKLWTILKIDDEGNQIGNADYENNKKDLVKRYPQLKFIKENYINSLLNDFHKEESQKIFKLYI